MNASNLRINGKPTTIQSLENARADGRPMVKPVFNPGRGCMVDAGWLPPATEAQTPQPAKARRVRVRKARTFAQSNKARAAEAEKMRAELRRVAAEMLADVEPVWLRDLAKAVGISPNGAGRACLKARIRTAYDEDVRQTRVVEVLP